MKKILLLAAQLILIVWTTNVLASSITQTELDKQTKDWNILSDNYTSLQECNQVKEKYNQEFTSYKRSDCFLNQNKYNYFICSSSSLCSVSITWTSTTINNSIKTVPNQDKLDVFLDKVVSIRKEINDDTKYKALLTQVKKQIETLGVKYKSNNTISQMLEYLNTWILKIQTEVENNKDIDNFFCELLWNCWWNTQNTNPPSSSSNSSSSSWWWSSVNPPSSSSSSSSSSWWWSSVNPPSSSSSSSSSSWWWSTWLSQADREALQTYPSWSWEPQDKMNERYWCTWSVPTYAEVWSIHYVWYQDVPGKNTVWKSKYSLSDADQVSEVWKSCTWYCDMWNLWNWKRCVSQWDIRFSSQQFKVWDNLKWTITTAWYNDSYYVCMETPNTPNSCSNWSNYTQLIKNSDWVLNWNTFTLSNFKITSNYPTWKYTAYLSVWQNWVVKDTQVRRYSFNVVPRDNVNNWWSTTSNTPTISLMISWNSLVWSVYTDNPSNTWTCMDIPWSSKCSNRGNWVKMPAPGWVQTSYGFALSWFSTDWAPRWVYTWYVAIGNNWNIGPRGSSSFTY